MLWKLLRQPTVGKSRLRYPPNSRLQGMGEPDMLRRARVLDVGRRTPDRYGVRPLHKHHGSRG